MFNKKNNGFFSLESNGHRKYRKSRLNENARIEIYKSEIL